MNYNIFPNRLRPLLFAAGMGMVLLLMNALHAQTTTRSELLKQKRLEKAQQLQPFQPSNFEKVLLFAESFKLVNQAAVGFHGFFPHLGGFRSGAGFSPGLAYSPTPLFPDYHFSATATVSFRGYIGLRSMIGALRGPWQFWGYGMWRKSPLDTYYGIGADTQKEDRTAFRLDDLRVGGGLAFQPHEKVRSWVWTHYNSNEPPVPPPMKNIPPLRRNSLKKTARG